MEEIRQGRRCGGCFRERPEGEGPCPACGFDPAEEARRFPEALTPGMVLRGRYQVGRVLGRGRFGATYLVWDAQRETRAAVKEYLPAGISVRGADGAVTVRDEVWAGDFAWGLQRFREEARALMELPAHPALAAVTDCFDENGTAYFAMDYVEAPTLAQWLAGRGGRVPAEEALAVMSPVLDALAAAHRAGVVHGEVTPHSIRVTEGGGGVLVDFGGARRAFADQTGSPDAGLVDGCAPPEQYIRQGGRNPRADVYGCAACLYGALTGALPPKGTGRKERDTLLPPARRGADVPVWLDRAVRKGLAVRPEDRFADAGEFLDVLKREETVALPRPSGPAGWVEAVLSGVQDRTAFLGVLVAAAIVLLTLLVSIATGGLDRARAAELEPDPPAAVETAAPGNGTEAVPGGGNTSMYIFCAGATVLLIVCVIVVTKPSGKKKRATVSIWVEPVRGVDCNPGEHILAAELLAGGAPGCGILLMGRDLPDRLCRLFLRDGAVWIEALTEEVMLNGAPLTEPGPVRGGDEIAWGRTAFRLNF